MSREAPVALPVRNVPSFDWTRDGMHIRQNVTEGDYVLREDYEALGKRLSEASSHRSDAVSYLAGVALGAISYAVNSGNHSEAMQRVQEAYESLRGGKPAPESPYAIALQSALERARGCINGLLARTPVRDVSETMAEIDAALAKNPGSTEPTNSSRSQLRRIAAMKGDPIPDFSGEPLTGRSPEIVLDFTTEMFGTRVYRCKRCECSFTYDPTTHKCPTPA